MPARRRDWTTANNHVRLEPASLRGDLPKVAKPGPCRLQRLGPYLPRLRDDLTPLASTLMIDG
jgi:hypothetical protein